MSLDARNAAAMRSAQLAYDSASDPRAEIDDGQEPSDEDYTEARRRLLKDYDEENLLPAMVEALAKQIANGGA